jgi:hypothetical protein
MAGGPLTNVNLGQLVKDFGSNVWAEVKSVFSAIGAFLGSFFSDIGEAQDDITQMVADFKEIKANVQVEIDKIKNFQFEPRFKSRVINVPRAFDGIHDFVSLIKDDLVDKFEDIIDPLKDLVQVLKAEAQTFTDQDKPSAMARSASTVHSAITALHLARNAMDAAKDFSELATNITDRIETLDDLFLPQNNPKKKVTDPGYHYSRKG